jgi:hypothetical protein
VKETAGAQKPWAFSAPVWPAVPRVVSAGWVRNPIDAFIAARLEAKGLRPSPEADRRTLIRRVTFDLTGLPPTPEEVEAFVRESAARPQAAYEKLVDRLLASPRHGERWALYWLDLVRFAESDGFKADDPRPTAWRYRDYVIGALNQDKPYDRFVREQLAGDELYPGDPDALIATAFNRHYPDEYNARNLEQRRQEILNDMTDTTAQVFLGLTVGCARCHDHKFDPISQKDYYRLQAFFSGYRAPDDLVLNRPEEVAAYRERLRVWEEKTDAVRRQMGELEAPYRRKLSGRDKSKFARELQDAYDTPPEKRTPLQHQLADMLARQVRVNTGQMTKAMKPEVRKEWQALSKQLTAFDALRPRPLAVTMGLTDVGPVAPATYLLKRGNMHNKGALVQPGFLSAIDPGPVTITPPPGAKSTGRRGALARWLTRPDHPLTARVLVNRLWQHHFGRGLVGTPSDFGEQGERPTHPELLDWLAREFVERGWSMKALHRLMVTSATYRQTSQLRIADRGLRIEGPSSRAASPLPSNPQSAIRNPQSVDPDNRLLWRMNRRRLEGEALRDAMLSASGLLNLTMGGPSVFPELPKELGVPRGGWAVTPDAHARNRRSVYVFVKRNLRYPLFGAFDAPDANETCARRHVSTNAPQALMLLNGKLTQEIAQAFAARVLREAGNERTAILDRVYRLALGRSPAAREAGLAAAFLDRQTALLRARLDQKAAVALPVPVPAAVDPAFAGAVVDLCHVLLNVNEFAYVD